MKTTIEDMRKVLTKREYTNLMAVKGLDTTPTEGDAARWLSCAFAWDSTKQGDGYWRKIGERLEGVGAMIRSSEEELDRRRSQMRQVAGRFAAAMVEYKNKGLLTDEDEKAAVEREYKLAGVHLTRTINRLIK